MNCETAINTVFIGYALLFVAYVVALVVAPDAVAGPHSWEWAGRTCPDPGGHHLRGPCCERSAE